MYLATSAHIKQLDNIAVTKFGFTVESLMENAGKALYNAITCDFTDKKYAVFCGKGNNGGDGFTLARLLNKNGYEVICYITSPYEELGEDAKKAYDKLKETSVLIKDFKEDVPADFIIIDALLGVSLSGAPRGNIKEAIIKINNLKNDVISIDVPSGLSVDNGKAAGDVIHPIVTYTLALDKIGLNIYPGAEIACKVKVLDIGIPIDAVRLLEFNIHKTDVETIRAFLPKRSANSNKGTYGHVGIVGGSPGMTGSICMAATAALKIGAGLVYVFVPDDIFDIISVKLTECVILKESDLKDYLDKLDVIAIGMGYSQNGNIKHIMKMVMQKFTKPVVIDADGLNFLSCNKKLINSKVCPTVMTPHPGEFARLTDISIDEIQSSRIYLTEKFAKEFNTTLLLKGAGTVISSPDGKIRINTTGNSGMATAGSGDVLSGIIAGLLAQGADTFESASIGAYIHGLAGDIGVEEKTEYSLTATDIINNIHNAIKKII